MEDNADYAAREAREAREAVQRSLDWQDDSAVEKADND
jgi:hypothetical protein